MKALENNKGISQTDLATAIREDDRQAAAHILHQRSNCSAYSPEFREYLSDLATALATDDWDKISQHWLDDRFIDDLGNIVLCANYSRRINGDDISKLTLLEGKICDYSPVRMEAAAIKVFGRLNQNIPKLLVLDLDTAIGNVGNEEAFISPGGWSLPHSERLPAILVANLHRKRFDAKIRWRIRRIFDPETAQLLLSAIDDAQAIVQEYIQHESGHALGLGIDVKDRLKLFTSPQQSGLEEYMADVCGWRLAEAAFEIEAVGKLIACTLIIRWGIDFARPGAPTQDHDSISSLLILDRFLQSGEMYLTRDRLLALRDVSWDGLFKATHSHRVEAEELVQEELAHLDNPPLIVPFYEAKTARSDTISLHQEFIDRCADLSD
jgi:hypothetical protein